ncbi:MAG: N-acetylneuraminate synthase [Bacteroidetes bacterium CG02_land_8_20_14_3_00_31_25]|nr:MAG: N-acetylneuraminate synthase [Bacteroidetes bacterium CG02_land_8_20_14_3_00_31_25]
MEKVFIIAEAGVNHNGDINIAKKLIDVAFDSGANSVKFQTFKAENIVSSNAPKADYQLNSTEKSETQFQMLKKLELDLKSHQILIDYCKIKGIIFLSTPFDLESIDLLNKLGIKIFKIPSGEITNLPYLKKIGALNKKVILSTGMANINEIRDALRILTDAGTSLKNITVLHANTEYPTPFEDVNLLAMQTIGRTFDVKVGYSDHTNGIEVPIAAVALGACVIEKHFTLDRNMEGPDHKASLEPPELKAMVSAIRNIEKAMSGNGNKEPSNSEKKNIPIARKSIVAKTNIKKGEIFSENNITIKRPGTGISPMLWYNVIGKISSTDFKPDDLIIL